MLLTEVVATVRTVLDRAPDELSDDDIIVMVRLAEGCMSRALREHPRNRVTSDLYFLPTLTGAAPQPVGPVVYAPDGAPYPPTLVADGLWAAYLPDTFFEMIEVTANRVPQTQVFSVSQVTCGTFMLDGSKIWVPAIEGVLATYLRTLAPLDDNTENWVSLMHPDLYVYATLKEAGVFLRSQHLGTWEGEYNKRMGELQLQGWNQRLTPKRTS